MKQKLFNVTVYAMLAYSMVSAGYIALPAEYQTMIPQYNDLVALVTGASTLLLGSGGLAVQSYLNRAKEQADSKFNLLASNYLSLEKRYESVVEKYDIMSRKYTDLEKATERNTKAVERNNKLMTAHLESKLTNPMIDSTVEKMIKGVIGDE